MKLFVVLSVRFQKFISPQLALLCLVAALAASLAGCESTKYAEKADEVVEVEAEVETIEGIEADRWCSDFGQPALDDLVELAWAENMELKAAWARLRQAEAAAEIADAPLWPSAEANSGLDYSNGDRGEFGSEDASGQSGAQASWELSAAAAYEVDIFGRLRHRARAAEIEAEAIEADARALAITLTSEVAEAWFDVVAYRERVALLEAQLEASQDILNIIRIRARRGLVPALDIAQQERNLESIRGEVADTRGLLRTSLHRLAVLVGQPPTDGEEGDDALVDPASLAEASQLPKITPLSDAGVPANLLERRPDIQAAYLLLEAADERTAAAVADRLPRLQLSASLGFESGQIASLFEQLLWGVGAGITQPIFEGGRLRAEVERSEAIAQEQLYEYANTLLVAMREVRDAIALELTEHERIESLEREYTIAQDVLELARRRYRTGAIDYLRVLTALQALQEVERTLLEARRQQVSHRIGLCRALGGSWVESVEPSIDTDQ